MNPHHFLITFFWDVLDVNAKLMKLFLRNIPRCLNHVFLLGQLKRYQGGKSLTPKQSRGSTTWKDMLENAFRDIVSWQTKKRSSKTQLQVLAWMITNSRRKNLNQWRIIQSMLTNCLDLLVPGTNLRTRHFVVCQQTCKSSHKIFFSLR